MPLIPLDVRVSDNKLSQIKGWRVPHLSKRIISYENYAENSPPLGEILDEEMLLDEGIQESGKYWSSASASISNPFINNCRLRFQQTRVEVYTRFLSSDQNSGREASLLNRRHSLDITHLVRNLIRVSDNKVLRLRGNIVEGMSVGRADVEIISALTGSVIGSREIRVTTDRESITQMEVRPISGISLDVQPFESNSHNIWSVKTTLHSKLTKQYQEALLDARLYFSDRSSVSLSEIMPTDYKMTIRTFKGVVENVTRESAPYAGISSHSTFIHEIPRIIALLPGQGELVHLTLDLVHACQRKKSQPLAAAFADIDVDFELPDSVSSSLQNDAIFNRRFGNGFSRQYNLSV